MMMTWRIENRVTPELNPVGARRLQGFNLDRVNIRVFASDRFGFDLAIARCHSDNLNRLSLWHLDHRIAVLATDPPTGHSVIQMQIAATGFARHMDRHGWMPPKPYSSLTAM
jgi:hypothetical protein